MLRSIQISAALLLYVSMMNAQISGVAFRDYNGNGIKDGAGEPGVGEVIVKLYINSALPNKDLLIGTDLTDATGFYDFSSPVSGRGPNPGEKIRVEFEIPTTANCGFLSNQLDFSSQSGQVYGSSVQVITAPQSNVNFALNYSGEFVLNPAPTIYVPCYVNG
ncbi:MAG TPA: SdrD B-like domain-containing protein, partial [Saprospiraceae bacterium]|nr:SdrD B-like domain-containing protein [Saprospiraceae bacterium]